MALDIKGFVTPEQSFEGLYKLGEVAGKRKEDTAKNKKTMQSTLKFMMDPKDYYTGTMFDPEINQKFYNAAQKAYDFIEQNPNATDVQLQTYILPNIKELNDYANIAKFSKSSLDEAIKNVPSGYDKQKIYQLAQSNIFKNADGSTRDINSVKQEMQMTGYDPIKRVIEENPDLVTTSEGIDEWLKSQEKKKSTQSIETGARGEGGGTVKKFDLTIEAPSWAIPEVDAKGELVIDKKTGMGRMIPEYDVAVNGTKQILHDGQPVKLLKDVHFNSILSKDPATADWVRGQVKKRISEYKDDQGNPIAINSPQAELVAKNVLWEELNRRNVGNFEKSESKVTTTRAPREGGVDGAGGAYRNYFDEISNVFKEGEYNFGAMGEKSGKLFHYSVNNLEPDTGAHIVELINKRFPDKKYNADQVYIVRNNAGNLEARASKDNKLLMPISSAVNIGGEQPGKFGKEKAVVETEKEKFQNVRQGKITKAVNAVKNGVKAAVKKVTGSSSKEKDPLGLGL